VLLSQVPPEKSVFWVKIHQPNSYFGVQILNRAKGSLNEFWRALMETGAWYHRKFVLLFFSEDSVGTWRRSTECFVEEVCALLEGV
jgi:hypothetical protein